MNLLNDINVFLQKIRNVIKEVLHKIIKIILKVILVLLFINYINAIIGFFENLTHNAM